MTIPQDPTNTPPDAPTAPAPHGWVQLPEPAMPAGYDQPIESDNPGVRDDEPPANLDDDGRAHFVLIDTSTPEGDPICGGCGNAWPCDTAYELGLAVRPDEPPAPE